MTMKEIVVGLDGSHESARALYWACDLAAVTDATITAVSVFDARAYISAGMAPIYLPDFNLLRDDLVAQLHQWCHRLRAEDIAHREVVRDGSAPLEILAEADQRSADLIVVGSRGRGGFAELLLGSVAHHVTTHSKHPVVVIPKRAVTSMPAEPAAPGVQA